MIRRITILLLIVGCEEQVREEIIARHSMGKKKILVKYKGLGADEVIIERLKVEASNLGANGVVIKNTENKNKQNVSYGEEGETTVTNVHYKVGTATAIFVK